MGQFTVRPEEPTEWAGLPSEPLPSRPVAESLAPPVESADSLTFLSGAVQSVVIPLVPPVEAAPTAPDAVAGESAARDDH